MEIRLIIFCFDLEIALRMVANRAYLRSLLSYDYVTAIGAFPDGILVACEDNSFLDLAKKFPVAFLMGLLDGGDAFEEICDLGEPFFPGGYGETGIHVSPLVVLAISSICKIDLGCRYRTAMKELEPDLGVFLFILGSLLEELADLDVTVLLGPGGIIKILGVSLALTGESSLKILLSLGSFQFHINQYFTIVDKRKCSKK